LDCSGDLPFKQTVSLWLSKLINCEVNPENIMSTCGNSQAIDYCFSNLFKAGDSFFIEAPTYHLALRMAQDRKLNVKIKKI